MANETEAVASSDEAPHPSVSAQGHGHHEGGTGALMKLAVGALGVVYGDIGTSPLYAVKERFFIFVVLVGDTRHIVEMGQTLKPEA